MTPAGSNARFYTALGLIGGLYIALILAMIFADWWYWLFESPGDKFSALQSEDVLYSIKLSLISCFVTMLLSVWVAVPFGYLLSRTQFWGRPIVETILDIPIVLPPLVIGISLLILFQTAPGKWIEELTANRMGFLLTYLVIPAIVTVAVWPLVGRIRHPAAILLLPAVGLLVAGFLYLSGVGPKMEDSLQSRFGTRITFQVPSVILAQFAVSCAFAVRTMRVTFDQISPRTEHVALTLGCTRWQAFWMVAVPESWRGIVSAATLAWARALGEFGPILIFAGATRRRTEVLSTTVFLEFSVGHLPAAITVSLLMVVIAVIVLLLMRSFGLRTGAV
jgi:molybdate transport system permease protein